MTGMEVNTEGVHHYWKNTILPNKPMHGNNTVIKKLRDFAKVEVEVLSQI